jgi:hypothetical protein
MLLRSGQNTMRSSLFCSVTGPKRMTSIADQESTATEKASLAISSVASDGALQRSSTADSSAVVASWNCA